MHIKNKIFKNIFKINNIFDVKYIVINFLKLKSYCLHNKLHIY